MELSCFSMQKIERFIEKHVEDLKARTMGRVGPRQSGDRQNPTRASTTRTPFLEKKHLVSRKLCSTFAVSVCSYLEDHEKCWKASYSMSETAENKLLQISKIWCDCFWSSALQTFWFGVPPRTRPAKLRRAWKEFRRKEWEDAGWRHAWQWCIRNYRKGFSLAVFSERAHTLRSQEGENMNMGKFTTEVWKLSENLSSLNHTWVMPKPSVQYPGPLPGQRHASYRVAGVRFCFVTVEAEVVLEFDPRRVVPQATNMQHLHVLWSHP